MRYTDGGVTYEDAPVAREPANPNCRHCKTREIVSDGHGGWVHADDYKYQCDPNPKSGRNTMAEPGHRRA